jgi:hypothetical protein
MSEKRKLSLRSRLNLATASCSSASSPQTNQIQHQIVKQVPVNKKQKVEEELIGGNYFATIPYEVIITKAI